MDALSLVGGLIVGGIMLLKAHVNDQDSSIPENLAQGHSSGEPDDVGDCTWRDDSPVPTSPYTEQQADLDIFWGAGLILLTGGKGSGKSTASDAIIRRRILDGHYIKIFNHQADFGQYKGIMCHLLPKQELECTDILYGVDSSKVRRFESIASGIEQLLEISNQRLQLRQTKPESEWDFMEAPITIIIEEMSEWAVNISQSLIQEFWQCLNSEFRRANIYAVVIAHDTTSALLGGQKGYSKLIKTAGTVQLELQNKPDNSAVGGFSPTGKGILSVSGQNPRLIKTGLLRDLIPKGKEFDYRDIVSLTETPVKFEKPSSTSKTLKSTEIKSFSDSTPAAKHFTKFTLQRGEAIDLITKLRQSGLNQTQIIHALWDAKPGANEAYQNAITDYKELDQ